MSLPVQGAQAPNYYLVAGNNASMTIKSNCRFFSPKRTTSLCIGFRRFLEKQLGKTSAGNA